MIILIMFAGPPQRPMDLRYYDLTHDSVHLEWFAGFDMGSIQHFLVLRVYDGVTVVVSDILTDKRNATIEFCQVPHVVHKHELTMTRTLSQASGLFECIYFCLSGMANIHECCNCCH